MSNGEAGKGSTYRKVDGQKYRENYNRVFKKKKGSENHGRNGKKE